MIWMADAPLLHGMIGYLGSLSWPCRNCRAQKAAPSTCTPSSTGGSRPLVVSPSLMHVKRFQALAPRKTALPRFSRLQARKVAKQSFEQQVYEGVLHGMMCDWLQSLGPSAIQAVQVCAACSNAMLHATAIYVEHAFLIHCQTPTDLNMSWPNLPRSAASCVMHATKYSSVSIQTSHG